MIEHINIIDTLNDQIAAILDLMSCANKDVDINSINMAAEMRQTMLDEMMLEVNKIKKEWTDNDERKADD